MRRLVLVALFALAPPCAAARADYAPTDRPGPPLAVPASALSASLSCSPGVDHATRTPVLLVPGTGATPKDNYSWNYEPAFDHAGIPWCTVGFPYAGNDDIQVNGEYTVNAIRTMYARAGRRIDIIGHSQGGMVPRWAMRFWPDTRAMVEDLVGIAPSNHGSLDARTLCHTRGSCTPADWQQSTDSNFLTALNHGQETFPGTDYTAISSHTDEEVTPDGSADLHTGGAAITNVHVQDICPNDTTEHLGLGTYDPVAYALALDAIEHPGPADPARVSRDVCLEQTMPGVNKATFATDAATAAYDVEASDARSLTAEPPLACYVTAAGCAATARRAVASTCALTFHLHAFPGARVTRAVVRLAGHRTRTLKGHNLRTVAVTGPAHGVLRIVTSATNGMRRTSSRTLNGCASTRPHTTVSRRS